MTKEDRHTDDLLNLLLDYAEDNECIVKIKNYHGIYKSFKIQFVPEIRKRFGHKENFKLEVFNPSFKHGLEDILKKVSEKFNE